MVSNKRIPEDTVFFSVFLSSSDEDPEKLVNRLDGLRRDCLAVVALLSHGYIWQHQIFNLALHNNVNNTCFCSSPPPLADGPFDVSTQNELHANAPPLPPHLHGKLKYGDNIEDEWFVVYLLFAVSENFPDFCIRVWDTDGEFLLIEAAYSIPRWLKPENSWNRVFLKNGELHILPLPSSPAELYQLPVQLTLEDAIRILCSGKFQTKADDSVQVAIQRRLSGFHQNPNQGMHNVVCRVPTAVAQILKHEPQLVSLAVTAFYDRDVDSMTAASRMRHFLPKGMEVQFVDVVVRMSRAMYAQLTQQVFQAPKCYPMPHLSDPHYHEAEIGMKLTCGFEMMYWERMGYGNQAEGVKDTEVRWSKDAGWQAFLGSLKQTGYFKDLLEGSKEYKELMGRALEQYCQSSLFARVSAAMNAPIQRIREIVALPHSSEDFPRSKDIKSDDDSWLYNGEDDLRSAMLERQKEMEIYEAERSKRKKRRSKSGFTEESRAKDDFKAEEIVQSMHKFIEKMSSYEGAEFPGDKRETDEPVNLRTQIFLKELESAFGSQLEACDYDEGDASADEMDTSSSDMDSDDDEDMAEEQPGTSSEHARGIGNRASTSSTSAFMDEYSEVLERELYSSSLAKTFLRDQKGSIMEEGNKESGQGSAEEGLPPVNIDVNLLQNLLESYSSQHGLPGPASNLLGAMGLHLPDDKDKS